MGWGGEVLKKYSRKGKLNEKNSCTPINPKKYSCYGPKRAKEFDNEKLVSLHLTGAACESVEIVDP